MPVAAPVYSTNVSRPSFKANPQKPESNINQAMSPPPGNDKKNVSGIVLATALSAAVLGGGIAHGHYKNSLGKLERKIADAAREKTDLLTKNETLDKANKALQESIDKLKREFDGIFEGGATPGSGLERTIEAFKRKLQKSDYGYDITTPHSVGKVERKVSPNAIPLPEKVGTTNRADMIDIHIPEIRDGRFSLELPKGEAKVTHMPSQDFKPIKNMATTTSEDYADSVQWDNNKIARDLLQNFYDGHGQTLDGVKMNFVPTGDGKFRVRIEGKSTYRPNFAVIVGDSSKRNDANAAGNYGEGLKMVALKLLRDSGAKDVKVASDNWKLTYNLAKPENNITDKRLVHYTLDKAENKLDGNYIEFETADKNLLESLRNTVNRFYHSNNPHFKCPDFENGLVGIKNLAPGEKGGIYIAGQRFEFDGDYDGLDGVALFIKQKLPTDVLDPSRDRTTLNASNLEKIAQYLGSNRNMSAEDKVNMLKSLEKYWNKTDFSKMTPMHKFTSNFANWMDMGNVAEIKFPEKYIAYSPASPDVLFDLERNGYTVCHEHFTSAGMKTIKEMFGEIRKHDVVIPNDVQKQKILILKEALQKFEPSLKGKHFDGDELNAKIYLFDNTTAKERKMYSDCKAEAIIDKGQSKGFWIDKTYLDNGDFGEVLETALHELCHKAGGDETAEFSYKLTRVNADVISQMLNEPNTKRQLQALGEIWKQLN